jgi:cytochrome c-type biogenesis protein CcmE
VSHWLDILKILPTTGLAGAESLEIDHRELGVAFDPIDADARIGVSYLTIPPEALATYWSWPVSERHG